MKHMTNALTTMEAMVLMEIRISPSQLKAWSTCRESHRLGYLCNIESAYPKIHYHFGKVVHKMCQGYWDGKPYMESFQAALELSQQLDPRKLDGADRKKWVDMCDTIAPITTVYYGYHDAMASRLASVTYNEAWVEWLYIVKNHVTVIANGIIDRYQQGVLTDTKTASAVGRDWKSDLKKRLLREPQLPFYKRFLVSEHKPVEKIQYEIIVKPYRGSEPYVEIIDCTKEFLATEAQFNAVMDWHIREIVEYYTCCREAQPWPMSHTACVGMFGDCEYLPICSGKASAEDTSLYQIKTKESNNERT